MLRVVFAVLLAVALLAVSTTALDHARERRSARLAESTMGKLVDATRNLRRTESSVSGVADAAMRTVNVGVPDADLDTVAVSYVAIGGSPGRTYANDTDQRDVVAYRLEGGPVHSRWIPIDVRVPAPRNAAVDDSGRQFRPLASDDESLVLRRPATVLLSLLERDGRTVVLARRG